MFSEERQEKISELLNGKSSIKVTELSGIFNVSESTIRRDLQEMEQKGLLTRTHGGAVNTNRTSFEPSFKEKEDVHHDEKVSIAKAAAGMIEEGDTIILDSGTTAIEIAKNIPNFNITVITNSIDIAIELSGKENIELIITGGSIRKRTRAMVGHLAESTLKNFRVDKAFIGANGISIEEGVTTPNFDEAHIKKQMMNVSNKVILVADNSKFNEVSFSVICPIRVVSTIITDKGLKQEVIDQLKESGVDVIVA